MIIKEVIKILDHTIYKNYSDKGVYIRNKTNGTLWSDVNSSIDYEYEETDIPLETNPDADIFEPIEIDQDV